MLGPVPAQGAAESDVSARLRVRSHVPGRKRHRAQAEEAGIKKAKPPVGTPSAGMGPQTRRIAFGKGSHRRNRAGGDPNPIRLWVVFNRGSAHEPQPLVRKLHGERLCRSQVVGILGKEANPLGQ